jgi:hypothetical protein
MASNMSLPQSNFMNALADGPQMNTQNYIIDGPGPMEYWNHSSGAERPMIKEEGPFPIQGSIGSLIAAQGTDFLSCGRDATGQSLPMVGSSPNCSGSFKPDLYTIRDTCGDECSSKYPESFGQKDFSFNKDQPWQTKVTDAHQIHAMQNLRAGMPGEGPASIGAYEWIPRVSPVTSQNSFAWDQEPVFQQVGNFLELPQFNNLRSSQFRG